MGRGVVWEKFLPWGSKFLSNLTSKGSITDERTINVTKILV